MEEDQKEREGWAHFFSFNPWSMKAVTILAFGALSTKFLIPSGLAIKLRKKIRSSGTPLDFRTSTAMIAEPPGSFCTVSELGNLFLLIKILFGPFHWVKRTSSIVPSNESIHGV